VKIAQINLPAYGAFTGADVAFDLSRSIHVVYGPNEAGKTTRRSAISDLLFGFPKTTRYAFKHDMQQLRVRATVDIDGALHIIERRKGTKDTLRDEKGDIIAEAILIGWLGGVSRDFFESYC